MEKKKSNQKEREISYMLNGKAMIIHSVVGLLKKTLYKMSQYLPKPYETFGGDINIKFDLLKELILEELTHLNWQQNLI